MAYSVNYRENYIQHSMNEMLMLTTAMLIGEFAAVYCAACESASPLTLPSSF